MHAFVYVCCARGAVVPSLSLRHYGKWSLRSSRPGISCGPVLCCFTSLTNKNKGQILHQAPVRGVLLGRRVHEEEGALFFFTVHTGHIHLLDAFSFIRLINFFYLSLKIAPALYIPGLLYKGLYCVLLSSFPAGVFCVVAE